MLPELNIFLQKKAYTCRNITLSFISEEFCHQLKLLGHWAVEGKHYVISCIETGMIITHDIQEFSTKPHKIATEKNSFMLREKY